MKLIHMISVKSTADGWLALCRFFGKDVYKHPKYVSDFFTTDAEKVTCEKCQLMYSYQSVVWYWKEYPSRCREVKEQAPGGSGR